MPCIMGAREERVAITLYRIGSPAIGPALVAPRESQPSTHPVASVWIPSEALCSYVALAVDGPGAPLRAQRSATFEPPSPIDRVALSTTANHDRRRTLRSE